MAMTKLTTWASSYMGGCDYLDGNDMNVVNECLFTVLIDYDCMSLIFLPLPPVAP